MFVLQRLADAPGLSVTIYNNDLAHFVSHMGYEAILTINTPPDVLVRANALIEGK